MKLLFSFSTSGLASFLRLASVFVQILFHHRKLCVLVFLFRVYLIINIICMLANTLPVHFHPKQANEEADFSPHLEAVLHHLFFCSTMLLSALVLVLIHAPRMHHPGALHRIFVNNR